MKRTTLSLLILSLFLPIHPALAQLGSGLAGPRADLLRASELIGVRAPRSQLIRRSSTDLEIAPSNSEITSPWGSPLGDSLILGPLHLQLLPLTTSAYYNSAYPRDHNNGALWAGRGLATELHGGLTLRVGPLSAALAPKILYHQNRDFETIEYTGSGSYSPLLYPGRPTGIDWPQRPGERSLSDLDLGQSYLRLDLSYLAIGVSNENLWWGPARRNPLLMSNTAPGFNHLFLGTSKPIDLWVGKLEAEAIWGRLEESEHFDDNPDNDRNLFAGLVIAFQPRGLPGLYLGAARSYLRDLPVEGLSTATWLLGPYRDMRDNPLGRGNPESDNQLFSIFARWAPPETGFEAYFEFGRDDHWADLDHLLAEPEVSGGYTLGFQHLFPRDESWLRLAGEFTTLSDPLSTVRRPLIMLYTHSQIRQGYTHHGRLLGASIGPNANSQYLGLDRFTTTGRHGIFVERIRYNVDANNERWVRAYGADGADIEFTIGLHQHYLLDHFELLNHLEIGWALTHSYRRNRNQLGLRAPEPHFMSERNWGLRLDLSWRPGW